MKGFVILLLGVIFVTLIPSSVPFIAADNSVGNKIVSEDVGEYKIYMHAVVRNAQGELISAAETLPCQFGMYCAEYLPHKITDDAFDTSLGKKEIITIDDIKYEKVKFSAIFDRTELLNTSSGFLSSNRDLFAMWVVTICVDEKSIEKYGFECADIFKSRNLAMYMQVGDVATTYWTILRAMN
tara:strand:- start:38 stop:586 length:549 start_codon:yes stop_codon:yes gene_type:complete